MSMIAVVTPWLNHPELAVDYFAAVETAQPDQVVVVDDGSDPALSFAAVRLDKPSGFCAATNAGLALVETDFVVFLNNDVKMIRPNWLEKIRDAVEPGVVVGPLRFDPHGNVDGVSYPYVDGWCAAMATEDARRIGGWDERYDEPGASYFSDNAFSFRARLHGLRLRDMMPGLSHKGGVTGGGGPVFEESLRVNGELWQRQVREAVA